jgi:hypothetical protein
MGPYCIPLIHPFCGQALIQVQAMDALTLSRVFILQEIRSNRIR